MGHQVTARPAPGSRCLKRGHPLANGHGGHPAHLLFCFPETPRFCKPYISHCYSDPPHQTHGWQLLTNCHQPPAAQPLLSASRKGGLEEWVFKTPSFSTMACIHTRLHQHCCTKSSLPQDPAQTASERPTPQISEREVHQKTDMCGLQGPPRPPQGAPALQPRSHDSWAFLTGWKRIT